MNEMLRNLGFGQVTNTKWTNGSTMMILVSSIDLNMQCFGDIGESAVLTYDIESTDPETTKHHIEKFMRMVGKCIQVDEE